MRDGGAVLNDELTKLRAGLSQDREMVRLSRQAIRESVDRMSAVADPTRPSIARSFDRAVPASTDRSA